MAEREQVKVISDDPEGYCLKYREDLLPGDRKYFPPPEIPAQEGERSGDAKDGICVDSQGLEPIRPRKVKKL